MFIISSSITSITSIISMFIINDNIIIVTISITISIWINITIGITISIAIISIVRINVK